MPAEIYHRRRRVITCGATLAALLWVMGATVSIVAAKENHTAQAEAFFSGREIPHLFIEVSDQDMEFLRTQKRSGASTIVHSNVLATVREGAHLYTNVALHLKGSASFRAVDLKPALTLSFDKVEEAQRFHGLEKISLNNSVQDPSLLCEKLGREMFAAAGIPAPRVTHAQVELNGNNLGVYLLIEGWNKQFLKHHFTDASGNLYERGNGRDVNMPLVVKSGDVPDDRSALKALADAALEPDLQKRWAALERTLDLDRFISGMAMEIMIGHWDGYCRNQNNFRIFHDRANDRMIFLPHGMDQLFGIRRDLADSPIMPKMSGLVAAAILETPEGRLRYMSRLEELHAKVFHVPALTNQIVETAARLRPLLADDPGALRQQENGVKQLLDRIPQRFETVGAQLKAMQTPLPPGGKEIVTFTRWEQKRDAGNPGFSKIKLGGHLQISGNGATICTGSYRAIYLLEPGRYRFEGHGMAENIFRGTNNGPVGAIGLRTSESTGATSVSDARGWTNLTHEFTVSATRYVDLICEYQGNKGKALFDPESLTLTRLANVSSPARPTPVERRGALDKR